MRTRFLVTLATVVVALSSCSGAGDAEPTTSEETAPSSAASAPADESAATEPMAEVEPTPANDSEPSVEPVTAFDLLLPDDVIEAYFPSFPADNVSSNAQSPAEFPEITNVRPKACLPLLRVVSTPLEDSQGTLMSAAQGSLFRADLGPSTSENVLVYASEAEAERAFAEVVDVLSTCKKASGEWPQTGPITFNDGMVNKQLDVRKIKELDDTVYRMTGAPSYDGSIEDYYAVMLAGPAIIWLEMNVYSTANVTNKRAGQVFDRYMRDAFEYARTGEVSDSGAAVENADLTLDCLVIEPLPYTLVKNYDEYRGKGAGEDLFVEQRLSVTNNCGKVVRGFKYDIEYLDEFGDDFSTGNGTQKVVIEVGQTKKTPGDYGFVIRRWSKPEVIETFVKTKKADVTVEAKATQILFKDKSSLP